MKISTRLTLSVAVITLTALSAGAQSGDGLRSKYLLPTPELNFSLGIPAVTIQSPAGYGSEAGDVFVGAGFQSRTRYTTQNDGAVEIGMGFGDARRYVGAEAALTSYGTLRSGFGNHLAASFKVHRLIVQNVGVAVGVENAWQASGTDGTRSFYGAVSNVFKLGHNPSAPFSQMALTAGVGSGRFQSEGLYIDTRNGVGAFGSVALRLVQQASAIADWSGQDLSFALSLAPFARIPLVITPGITDVTNNSGDGARFIIGVGTGLRITQLRDALGGKR